VASQQGERPGRGNAVRVSRPDCAARSDENMRDVREKMAARFPGLARALDAEVARASRRGRSR
jgi:hypothetical protein